MQDWVQRKTQIYKLEPKIIWISQQKINNNLKRINQGIIPEKQRLVKQIAFQ